MQETHPLKVLKYCPKCSSSDFRRSGERSLKCGNCQFHYFINASAAVAALISDSGGRLMLVTRGVEPDYGKLDLPGGFVDPGESVEKALSRELYEELGLKVQSFGYFTSAPNEYIFSQFSVFTLDLAFVVTPETLSDLNPMDDILTYRFYSEDEIDFENIPASSIRKFVKDFFRNERYK